MKKTKCPLCQGEFSDLSRHLVLAHNIKDINHLRSLTQVSPRTDVKSSLLQENIEQELKIDKEANLRKELILTILKVQGEPNIKQRKDNVKKIGSLLKKLREDTVLLNEGVEALIQCLKNVNTIIQEQAAMELENLLRYNELDEKIKKKIHTAIARMRGDILGMRS